MSNCAEKRNYAEYSILNSSNYEIQINSYEAGDSLVRKTINLEKNGGIWNSVQFEITRGPELFLEDSQALGGDSVVILFEGQKKISYTISDIEINVMGRNLFDYRNNETISLSESKESYRYTFTEADYEAAVPIED